MDVADSGVQIWTHFQIGRLDKRFDRNYHFDNPMIPMENEKQISFKALQTGTWFNTSLFNKLFNEHCSY